MGVRRRERGGGPHRWPCFVCMTDGCLDCVALLQWAPGSEGGGRGSVPSFGGGKGVYRRATCGGAGGGGGRYDPVSHCVAVYPPVWLCIRSQSSALRTAPAFFPVFARDFLCLCMCVCTGVCVPVSVCDCWWLCVSCACTVVCVLVSVCDCWWLCGVVRDTLCLRYVFGGVCPAGRKLTGSAIVQQYEKRRVTDAILAAIAFEGAVPDIPPHHPCKHGP